MDAFPKFIIENFEDEGNCLIIAKCIYHRQIAYNKENVIGGGWFSLENNIFTLFGRSEEFGMADIEDISDCVKNKKVFRNYTLTNCLCDNYTFRYKNVDGEILDI